MSKGAGDWEVDVAAMAGSVVHEIKNPLSTLSINAQLLLEEWSDASTPREVRAVKRLKIMASEVHRLEAIIQSFLRFTERHELDLRETSLNALLEDLEEFITPEANRNQVATRLGLDRLVHGVLKLGDGAAHSLGDRLVPRPAPMILAPVGEGNRIRPHDPLLLPCLLLALRGRFLRSLAQMQRASFRRTRLGTSDNL